MIISIAIHITCLDTIAHQNNMSRDARKPVLGVSEKVRHKSACTITEAVYLWIHQENMSVQYIPPYTPHLYRKKLGYAGVYLFFYFFSQNIDFGFSLEPSRVPIIYVLRKNKKNVKKKSNENFRFLSPKKFCVLHGHVFVLWLEKWLK